MRIDVAPVDASPDASRAVLSCPAGSFACAVGRSGIRTDKREGDGATPAGRFPLRRVLYRPDRLAPPDTALPVGALGRRDGWCDDPGDPEYNRQVTLPHQGSAEALWREDHLYDLIIVVGHNDSPALPGAGSAIFIHVAAPDLAATEGCIALELGELMRVVAATAPGDSVDIRGQSA